MKSRAVERLARTHLVPRLPGFVARGSLAYRRPVEQLLCGLSFDTSSFTSARIYVTAFVQPLFVPADCITLTFGDRLGDDFWDVDEDDPDPVFAAIAEVAERDALPLFDALGTLDRFCEVVPAWADADRKRLKSLQSTDDPVVGEALGFAELLRGCEDAGRRLVARALESEREDGEYASEERIANLERVLHAVTAQGLGAAQALLGEWRASTIAALRLGS